MQNISIQLLSVNDQVTYTKDNEELAELLALLGNESTRITMRLGLYIQYESFLNWKEPGYEEQMSFFKWPCKKSKLVYT